MTVYQCNVCNHVFEIKSSEMVTMLHAGKRFAECPKCGSEEVSVGDLVRVD